MPTTAAEKIAAARAEFLGTEQFAYFDVAARGLMPKAAKPAIEAMVLDRMQGTADKPAMFATVERVRGLYARLINARPDEIAFTKNVSEGINIVAAALPWKAGDNVVLCPELEHPSNIYPWLNLKERVGIEVRRVAAENGRVPAGAMAAAIDGRTRCVTTSLVTFSPGLRTDLATIGTAARGKGALFLVDGAQGIGVLDLDMAKLPVDALSVSTQKGLLALYGMGLLYVRQDLAETLSPPFLSRFSVDLGQAHEATGGSDNYALMPGARRFEVGNYNFMGAIAVQPGLDMIVDIGTAAIEAHVLALAADMVRKLEAVGVPVFAPEPGPHRGHIVAIGNAMAEAHDATDDPEMRSLYDALVAGGVRLSIRRGILRLSLHLYNNQTDVDRVVAIAGDWLAGRKRPAAE